MVLRVNWLILRKLSVKTNPPEGWKSYSTKTMKIGIHLEKGSYSDRWITYCEERNIAWKQVDCYQSDIIKQLEDCQALMWHFSQNSPRAMLFARQLLYSVGKSGKKGIS